MAFAKRGVLFWKLLLFEKFTRFSCVSLNGYLSRVTRIVSSLRTKLTRYGFHLTSCDECMNTVRPAGVSTLKCLQFTNVCLGEKLLLTLWTWQVLVYQKCAQFYWTIYSLFLFVCLFWIQPMVEKLKSQLDAAHKAKESHAARQKQLQETAKAKQVCFNCGVVIESSQ